jgi:hypothetical protein
MLTRHAVIAVLLLVVAAGLTRADTVLLRDGRKLQGEAKWSADGKKLEVTTRFGSLVVDRAEVLRIDEEETPEQELLRRRAALAPDDMAGRVALAEFCVEKQLERDAAALLLEVLANEPTGEAAAALAPEALAPFRSAAGLLGARLDYHLVEGRWLAPDDYYPARGFVRHRGRWVHRELVETIDDIEAAEERAKEARVLLRRAERAVEPAEAGVPEAEAALRRVERTLATLAADKHAAELDLESKEADRRLAEERALRAQRTLEVFVASGQARGEEGAKQLVVLQNDLALREGDLDRARRAADQVRARLQELLHLEAQGPQARADHQAAVARARSQLEAARAELAAARAAVETAERRIESLKDTLKMLRARQQQ